MRGADLKSKMLINLHPDNFEADWRTATKYIDKALQRITSTDGFGAFAPRWIPYTTMASVMAALLYHIERHKLGDIAYRYIRKWYWGSVFLETYAGAVESTLARDYRQLVQKLGDDSYTPDTFVAVDSRILSGNYRLRDVSRMNSSIYKGIMNLIAIRGARDFRADDSIIFHKLDDHHIFPRAYLNKIKTPDGKSRYDDAGINTILNRTLIQDVTNQKIRSSPPSAYIRQLVPPQQKVAIMASHFIDANALAAMEQDDYEAFLHHREQALLTEIRRQVEPDEGY